MEMVVIRTRQDCPSSSHHKALRALPETDGSDLRGSMADGSKYTDADFILAERAAIYLKRNISHNLSLNDIARAMATNRNKLSRVFKFYFGMTVFCWLREQRMIMAANMLRNTAESIQEISYSVGYPDSNNFSTAFKRAYCFSPLQYRKVHKSNRSVPYSKEISRPLSIELNLSKTQGCLEQYDDLKTGLETA